MISVPQAIQFGTELQRLNGSRVAGVPPIQVGYEQKPPSTCEFVYLSINGCQITPSTSDATELQRWLDVAHNTYDVLLREVFKR